MGTERVGAGWRRLAVAAVLVAPLVVVMAAPAAAAEKTPEVIDDAGGGSIQGTCTTSKKEVRNVRNGTTRYVNITGARAEGKGKQTFTISESRTFSNSWSATASIDVKAVTAGVGYSVTASRTVTVSGTKTVPAGKYGTYWAQQIRAVKLYDVWHYTYCTRDLPSYWRKVGTGRAEQFTGYRFQYSERNA